MRNGTCSECRSDRQDERWRAEEALWVAKQSAQQEAEEYAERAAERAAEKRKLLRQEWQSYTCSQCLEIIKRGAKICKHCQTQIPNWKQELASMKAEEAQASLWNCEPYELDNERRQREEIVAEFGGSMDAARETKSAAYRAKREKELREEQERQHLELLQREADEAEEQQRAVEWARQKTILWLAGGLAMFLVVLVLGQANKNRLIAAQKLVETAQIQEDTKLYGAEYANCKANCMKKKRRWAAERGYDLDDPRLNLKMECIFSCSPAKASQ